MSPRTIAERYVAGESCTVLAVSVGCSHTHILDVLQRQGIERRPVGRGDTTLSAIQRASALQKDPEKVLDLFLAGLPISKIAILCRSRKKKIRCILGSLGVKKYANADKDRI